MSKAGRCVFSNLLRYSLSPGQSKPVILRPCTSRSLSLTSQLCAKPRQSPGSRDGKESLSQPIKFSTSKASHQDVEGGALDGQQVPAAVVAGPALQRLHHRLPAVVHLPPGVRHRPHSGKAAV
ncbi:hypothetical protein PHYPO_G00003680 [Pangasianodon hypophthalmus]|uniref:Uncharacterized protein n=1 Tax=Pangasianodon hypophthalmus TaxID=310915 RepID=A0A5N5Q5R5_PANHP|nr:hypothetical protein PHYPO_G00003680 [Pangasianodon hypophthalmus]